MYLSIYLEKESYPKIDPLRDILNIFKGWLFSGLIYHENQHKLRLKSISINPYGSRKNRFGRL